MIRKPTNCWRASFLALATHMHIANRQNKDWFCSTCWSIIKPINHIQHLEWWTLTATKSLKSNCRWQRAVENGHLRKIWAQDIGHWFLKNIENKLLSLDLGLSLFCKNFRWLCTRQCSTCTAAMWNITDLHSGHHQFTHTSSNPEK